MAVSNHTRQAETPASTPAPLASGLRQLRRPQTVRSMLASHPPDPGTTSAAVPSHIVADRRTRLDALRAALSTRLSATDGTRAGPWVLELGCGHGHFLAAYARQYPNRHCLGVDFCRDRIRRAERKQQSAGLNNLHFLHAEIGEFIDSAPAALRFREVFVLFPDPWPKRRHRKNRLLSADFLRRIALLGADGCALFVRSDAMDYVTEVRGLLENDVRWRLLPAGELPFETATVFQQRARHFGSLSAVLVS